MSDLESRLSELASMPPAQLRSLWRDTFRKPAPDAAPDLLRRSIAWRLQERMHGGLTPSVRMRISKLQKKLAKSSLAGMPPAIALKPGTRLVRTAHNLNLHLTATKWPSETMGHIGAVPPPTKGLWSQR